MLSSRNKVLFKDIFLSACAAGLLIEAFPRMDCWPLAWIGLVPLLCLLQKASPSQAFAQAYGCGFLFFAGTLYWFVHVTLLGAVLLIAYLALYFGLFGLGYYLLTRRQTAWNIFAIASWWTILEFIRAHFLTGFGWVSLGHSQYRNLVAIQIADITGIYGVSFLIVLVNGVFKEWLEALCIRRVGLASAWRHAWGATIVTVLLCLAVIAYGFFRLEGLRQQDVSLGSTLSVAVIQANTPQEKKWDRAAWPDILAEYKILSAQAVKQNPNLIVWPETSYPGILWGDAQALDDIKSFVSRLGVPLLIGSVVHEAGEYYNTAILLSGKGDIVRQYRKIHLVPFGEYIPLRFVLPFLSWIVPIDDFTAGKEYTIFQVSSLADQATVGGTPFSVLICFEDTLEELSREFVHRGARWLVNITNDAWFQDTKAPFMHLQAAVFRTVENRRALVRAANTGLSGLIDPSGRMVAVVADDRGKKTYVAGYTVVDVPMSYDETFYTKYGDIFILGFFGCMLIYCFSSRRKRI